MKVIIVLATFAVAVASAGRPAYGPAGAYGAPAVSTGHSTQFRQEDNYGNYNFGYDESHATGATSRREEQTNGVRRGSYSLSDADGRRRTVNYVADHTGFRATVHTNEPGVEPKDPADVLINKEGYAHGPAPVAIAAGPAYGPGPVAIAAPAGPAYGPGPVAIAAGPAFEAAPIVAPLAAPVKVHHRAPVAIAAGPAYGPGPVAIAGPAYGPGPAYVEEAPAPRAFSYSFGAQHVAPVHAPAYGPAPIAGPAPVYQERLGY